MSRRAKTVAIALAVILMLAVGLTTFVLAQDSPAEEGNTTESPRQTFIGKVASILGVEEERLVDALKQAGQEMRMEASERCLLWAIENECIDEEEASQIREWRDSLPEVLQDLGHRMRLHLRDALQHHELPHSMPCP